MDTDLSDFSRVYSGQKCFVVGAGPSLINLDLQGIHQHVVISVNSSILLMPWQEGNHSRRFWVSNDVLCKQWTYFWRSVLRARCIKLVRTSWRDDERLKGKNFRYFKSISDLERQDIFTPVLRRGLWAISSVPTAIDFGLLLGCNRIYLLGVDHKMVSGNSHFWQFWPVEKWPLRKDKKKYKFFKPSHKQQHDVFDENLIAFESLKLISERQDAKIYNCSSMSIVESFEKISLDQALHA